MDEHEDWLKMDTPVFQSSRIIQVQGYKVRQSNWAEANREAELHFRRCHLPLCLSDIQDYALKILIESGRAVRF